MENEIVYSAQEVADILKIKKNTIYTMIKRGELAAYKVGNKVRISNLEIERYKKRSLSIQPVEELIKSKNILTETYYNPRILDEPVQRENGFIICGQDAALDTLARHLQGQPEGARTMRSYVGSYNGLYMLYQGQVSIASAHLWSGKHDIYNIPYVESLLPGTPVVMIRLFDRMQGFYVKKDNPKNILSWEDLKRKDIVIANREKGSGTRVLLDERLRMAQISSIDLPGYHKEMFSHLAVASAVARGSADFGIGIYSGVKTIAGLDFIPVQKESYDLVIKKEDLNKQMYQAVVEIIQSSDFRMELEGMKEYDITDLGKVIFEN